MKHYITDPPCAFIEAVVGGYSPIDKWTCHFARVAEKMRSEPWWTKVGSEYSRTPFNMVRGDVRTKNGKIGFATGAPGASGEIPWRTLHAEPSGTSASG